MNHYFATVARGLEPIAAQELERLGAQEVRPDFTGVHFQGDTAFILTGNKQLAKRVGLKASR